MDGHCCGTECIVIIYNLSLGENAEGTQKKREGPGGGCGAWVMKAFRCLQLIYGTEFGFVPLRYRTCGQRSLHGPGSDCESYVRQALRCVGGGRDAAPAVVRPAAVHGLRQAVTGRYVPWKDFGKKPGIIYVYVSSE